MAEPLRVLQRPKSLTSLAADEIRGRIVRGELGLGTPLSENALALELGVSKTPIREALLQLKMEGLVSIQPQRGSFVFDMTPQEIRQLGELRETLEVTALERAMRGGRQPLVAALTGIVEAMAEAVRTENNGRYRILDAEFHRTLFEHAGNCYLADCYAGFAFRIQALRARLCSDPALNAVSLKDHERLRDLIDLGDAEGARALLVGHMTRTIGDYLSSMEQAAVAD
jgi:DNA-binding GntR family transcriptional regulator